jgi:pyruvate formate lyase activating enzyme
LPEIKGFLDTSFVDWPGKVAATVFLPRCNFRCPYCHNHRLVLAPETFETWPLQAVLERLEGFRGWLDGVCVTGGEPTVHEGLTLLLAALQDRGWAVKLDTNGARPEVLSGLLTAELIDAVSLDIKAPLEAIPYRRNAGPGADPEAVRASLAHLAVSGLHVQVRTTVHPALLSRQELLRLAQEVARVFIRARGREIGAVRFTPQRCKVDDPLDVGLRDRRPLDPSTFDSWAREAGEVFERALRNS